MENQTNTEKKPINSTFEIDKLVAETYKKIAELINEGATAPGVKQISLEIVEEVAKAAFYHVGLTSSLSVHKEEEHKEDTNNKE